MSPQALASACPATHINIHRLTSLACPGCGKRAFQVDEAPDADDTCERLHVDDQFVCVCCGETFTGQALAVVIARRRSA